MHANETKTDAALVRRLLAAQFPAWADLPVEPVGSSGTVNAIYRLGTDLTVRLPRVEGGSRDVATEHRWLPHLAPHLPHAIPAPLAQGVPGEGYPWSWSVCRWLDGTNPPAGEGGPELASDIAEFVLALRHVDTTGGPPAFRSEPLATRDTATRGALDTLHGVIDTGAAADVWSAALRAAAPEGPPVWVHGDLQPGNVLVTDDGRIERGHRLRLHGPGRPRGGPDPGLVPAPGGREADLPYAGGGGPGDVGAGAGLGAVDRAHGAVVLPDVEPGDGGDGTAGDRGGRGGEGLTGPKAVRGDRPGRIPFGVRSGGGGLGRRLRGAPGHG